MLIEDPRTLGRRSDEGPYDAVGPDDGGPPDNADDDWGDRDDGDRDEYGGDDVRWVTVATYWKPTDAQIARLRLEGHGIDAVILDENLVATDWLFANAIGGIKVQVPEPEAARARALLARPGDAAAVSRDDGAPVANGQHLCPRCGDPDIHPAHLSRRVSFVARFVCALLIPLGLGRRTRCAACGHEWR